MNISQLFRHSLANVVAGPAGIVVLGVILAKIGENATNNNVRTSLI